MKRVFIIICACVISLGGFAQHEHSGTAKSEKTGKSLSPHTSAMAMIGGAHVHIDYSSPSVRNRIIFGGLVGYDAVWQAGAHRATWIETDRPLKITGKILPAGKYGFFVIPGKDKWKVMFNTRWDQHGKDEFDEKENVVSIDLAPEELNQIQESLIYNVKKVDDKRGVISLEWEKVRVEIPFEVVTK